MVYELTEWGAELEPILLGLQRWGVSSPRYAPEVPVGCDAAMLSLKNGFPDDPPGGLEGTLEVRFVDTATFAVRLGPGGIDIRRGAAERADAVIETDPQTLEEVAFGMQALRTAERAGALRIDGDRDLVQRFFGVFDALTAR
jgi:hypothetical protein